MLSLPPSSSSLLSPSLFLFPSLSSLLSLPSPSLSLPLPLSFSLSLLSGTLGQDHLRTTTSVAASVDFTSDRLWLNGTEEDMGNPRLQICLSEMRKLARRHGDPRGLADYKVHICSVNNFPTAAGLASSASGYACLVFTLAKLYDLRVSLEDLSTIARQGSGSACRSLFGGFVKWEMGQLADGSDSRAVQVVPETHWPDLQVLILVVSDHKKGVSSTSGMQTSMKTSELLRHRADHIVPERMRKMEEAIVKRDFEQFALTTMQDSNQFHATCLDTYPPIFYMNDISRLIVHLLTKFNALPSGVRAAYTYDAGPNCVIYAQKADIPAILRSVFWFFPPAEDQTPGHYFNDRLAVFPEGVGAALKGLDEADWYRTVGFQPQPGSLRYILHTVVGDGPRVLSTQDDSLLTAEGQPKAKKSE